MINMKITWLMDLVAVITLGVCVTAVVLLGLHYEALKDRHCLALLLMDDVVMDRRWVTDGESEG